MAIDTASYKARLEEMLDVVKKELSSIGVQNPDNPADWVERTDDINTPVADPIDVADRVEDYDERRATLAALETRYNNIRRALGKIDEGTYGICEISGKQIEEDRLDANPAARTDKEHIGEEENLPK